MRIALVLICMLTSVYAQEPDSRSTAEFRSYVMGKLPNLTEEQAAEIAKQVDKNGDGVIDAAEFATRMEIVRQVMSGAPRERVRPQATPMSDYLQGKPVVTAPLTADNNATLLLIVGDEIAEAWLPFARWKTRQGIATKVMTVRQIARGYQAASIQEKIRLCVREHIENFGSRWILLGGDSSPGGGLVPGGHTTVHEDEPEGIPTDIVYLSPTNWDADGDGIYGEWDDDRDAITYPDGNVGLGRVPVRTAEDVRAFTQKVIAYESQYPATAFASNMLYTSTERNSTPKVRASWDKHIGPAWPGDVFRFFSSESPWDDDGEPGSYQLSARNLATALNDGVAGKLHIHGHGLLRTWILEDSEFDVPRIRALTNTNAYPLITTVSCNTGEYDSRSDPSVVEAMLRQPNAGSVAVVAPIRTGKMHFHSPEDFALMVSEGKLDGTTMTMTRYWVNGLSKGKTTGEALMATKHSLATDARKSPAYHLCICEINLLGDPTLDFRATAPRSPRVEAPKRIALGKQKLRVQTDAAGASVCVWRDLEVFEIAAADADGSVEFDIDTTSGGELLVTVTGPSLNTVTTRVRVGDAAEARVKKF